MITIKEKTNSTKFQMYCDKLLDAVHLGKLDDYGKRGVIALSAATPVDTGLTASSWVYEIQRTKDTIALTFKNTNIQNGVPIAIILQYGHGTRNGGYVQGRDYINPAIKPIFDNLAKDMWRDITKL